MRWRIVVGVALAAAVVSCGGAAKRKATTGVNSSASPQDQIRALESQNRTLLGRLDLGQPEKAGVDEGKQPTTTSPQPRTSARCDDVCRITASICGNADRICRIAREKLPNDPWAKRKCDEAHTSCRDARARCDRCRSR